MRARSDTVVADAPAETWETVILLAEDDAIVRNLVRTMLSKEGYAVLTANDGAEALEVCKAFTGPINLVLTDMDGAELAAAIREQRPETKIIIMSGYTVETIRTENTPDAFLRKPFVPPTLLRCVQRVLTSSGPVQCEQ